MRKPAEKGDLFFHVDFPVDTKRIIEIPINSI